MKRTNKNIRQTEKYFENEANKFTYENNKKTGKKGRQYYDIRIIL